MGGGTAGGVLEQQAGDSNPRHGSTGGGMADDVVGMAHSMTLQQQVRAPFPRASLPLSPRSGQGQGGQGQGGEGGASQ